MQSIHALTGKVIVTKNAWNCFRIKALAELFPNSHFLWIRRDIALSAVSDLEARYRRGGPMNWNSATTANYLEIQRRPYWEQVVEQQYEYNHSIGLELGTFAPGKYIEVWYEDLCADVRVQLDRLSVFFSSCGLPMTYRDIDVLQFQPSSKASELKDDYAKIVQYIQKQANRMDKHIYSSKIQQNTLDADRGS
jgi:hypothetical protein